MYVLFVAVAVLVVFTVAVVATGRGDGLEPAVVDRPAPELPAGRVLPRDVRDVRFALGLRGYRMDQVDAVLERLADELAARDGEVERLSARLAAPLRSPAAGDRAEEAG